VPHKAQNETKHYIQSTQEEMMRRREEISPGLDEAMIRVRAHEIFLQRGGTDGHDVDDWLQAESELLILAEPESAVD
jgi:hypothetical protein